MEGGGRCAGGACGLQDEEAAAARGHAPLFARPLLLVLLLLLLPSPPAAPLLAQVVVSDVGATIPGVGAHQLPRFVLDLARAVAGGWLAG